MKGLCFLTACLIGGPLFAESIGNIEFQFPPSVQEWVLLTEYDSQSAVNQDNDGNNAPYSFSFKIYTHKVGNTFELFTAASLNNDADDDDDYDADFDDDDDEDDGDEFQTAELAQMFINEQMASYFPNHQLVINQLDRATEEAGFVEWEVNDGVQNIVKGLGRFFETGENSFVVFSYVTTAANSEQNAALWTDALNQIQAPN